MVGRKTSSPGERQRPNRLVYFEELDSIENARFREKQLKGWKRDRKEAFFNAVNPGLRDLFEDLR